jgi:murein DD-endopeptidase MepM/ murein hydrolase activator NlpD
MVHGARKFKVVGLFGAYLLLALATIWLVAGSAESSAVLRIDQRATLERLRRDLARVDSGAADSGLGASLGEAESGTSILPGAEIREVNEIVKSGDTLPAIFHRLGIADGDVTHWMTAAKRHRSLVDLEPAHALAFLLPRGTDRLAALQYEIADDAVLVLHEDHGAITGRVERLPSLAVAQVVAGTIESSFYASARRAGVPDSVISRFVDIFGWDVDFRCDVRRGDSFRISYETEDPDANPPATTQRIVAAELIVQGRVWRAVRFEAEDEGPRYYSPEGRPYGRAFLRYPLEFSRISSIFADARMHPILRIVRPHHGVDFAAPFGTPIRAIGAGTVSMAHWDGGFGRTVRIDHGVGLSSQYSHMSKIAQGIHAGVRVKAGQVIGTVGATGLATGPHCHFALWRNGTYIDPLTAELPAAPPLDQRLLAEFTRTRDERLAELLGTAATDRLASGRRVTDEPRAEPNG